MTKVKLTAEIYPFILNVRFCINPHNNALSLVCNKQNAKVIFNTNFIDRNLPLYLNLHF